MHQFDKVEMFTFVEPEESRAEHERLLAIEEEILQALGIPYRVVNIAVDDLGASAAKKYDLEAWLPGQERYRELTSCSNTTDFQARRLDVALPARESGGPRHVHTLNGTAVAVGRTIIALVENGQREDGSVALPAVLADFGAPAGSNLLPDYGRCRTLGRATEGWQSPVYRSCLESSRSLGTRGFKSPPLLLRSMP